MRFSSKETFFVNHVMVLGDRKPHLQVSLPDNSIINLEIRIILPPKINKFLLTPLKPIRLTFIQLARYRYDKSCVLYYSAESFNNFPLGLQEPRYSLLTETVKAYH